MLHKILLTLAIGTIALAATACNTVKGAGKDLESASSSTKDAINGK